MPSEKNAQHLYKLSQAEMNDPHRVIDELFDFADLPDVRELLWNWLKTTVTGTYPKNLSATERSVILTLYEKLEKLVEANHVMHSAHKNRKGKSARKDAKAQRE
jgi:hypothetical protein